MQVITKVLIDCAQREFIQLIRQARYQHRGSTFQLRRHDLIVSEQQRTHDLMQSPQPSVRIWCSAPERTGKRRMPYTERFTPASQS